MSHTEKGVKGLGQGYYINNRGWGWDLHSNVVQDSMAHSSNKLYQTHQLNFPHSNHRFLGNKLASSKRLKGVWCKALVQDWSTLRHVRYFYRNSLAWVQALQCHDSMHTSQRVKGYHKNAHGKCSYAYIHLEWKRSHVHCYPKIVESSPVDWARKVVAILQLCLMRMRRGLIDVHTVYSARHTTFYLYIKSCYR